VTSDLALLGGKPVANAPQPHFTWPPITGSSAQAVLRQLKESISIPDRSGIIARLENALCAYTGSKHTVLTSSGTAALHSVYAACGIGPGDEVIVPAYTFFATATPRTSRGSPAGLEISLTRNMSAHLVPVGTLQNPIFPSLRFFLPEEQISSSLPLTFYPLILETNLTRIRHEHFVIDTPQQPPYSKHIPHTNTQGVKKLPAHQ